MPLALSQGTFDGLVSSNESLVSAKLWDAGVKYALEDHQWIAEYIPLASQVFWDKLTPDLQKMMAEQEQVAKEIKVSPEMVKLIMAEAGNGS